MIIEAQQLKLLYRRGYTAKAMARHFECSTSVLYKRLYEENLHMRDRYNCDNQELEQHIRELNHQFPNSGAEVGYIDVLNMSIPVYLVNIITSECLTV